MRISICQVGSLETNCYLVINEAESLAWIVDPGAEADKIARCVETENVSVKGILITHSHFDHVGAAGELSDRYDCPIYLHKKEEEEAREGFLVHHAPKMYRRFAAAVRERGRYLADEQPLRLGSEVWYVKEVPGHSLASLCYYYPDGSVLLSGDTLFQACIGRTDLCPRCKEDLAAKIREKLMCLPEETMVLPGHGPSTTIGMEKRINPYLGI